MTLTVTAHLAGQLRQDVFTNLSETIPSASGRLRGDVSGAPCGRRCVAARMVRPVAPDACRKARRPSTRRRARFSELSIPTSADRLDQRKEALSTFRRPTRASHRAWALTSEAAKCPCAYCSPLRSRMRKCPSVILLKLVGMVTCLSKRSQPRLPVSFQAQLVSISGSRICHDRVGLWTEAATVPWHMHGSYQHADCPITET